MKSRSRSDSTSDRMIRAFFGSTAKVTAIIAFLSDGPSTVTARIATRMNGNASSTSMTAMMTLSTTPPLTPATRPIAIPTIIPTAAGTTPKRSEIGIPASIRAVRSRPRTSVPSGLPAEPIGKSERSA